MGHIVHLSAVTLVQKKNNHWIFIFNYQQYLLLEKGGLLFEETA